MLWESLRVQSSQRLNIICKSEVFTPTDLDGGLSLADLQVPQIVTQEVVKELSSRTDKENLEN